jgi:hypothetical protein
MQITLEAAKDFLGFEEKPDAACEKCPISVADIVPDLKSQYRIVTNQRIDTPAFNEDVDPFVFFSIETFEAWIVVVADMLISKGWLDIDLLDILDDSMLDGSDLYVAFDESGEDIRVFDISEYGDVLAYTRNVEALRILCRQALRLAEAE